MNTAQYAIQTPVVQPQFDSIAFSFNQIAAEVKEYLKAVKAAWNEPLSHEGRMARLVEQQMRKAYLSHGIEGVDAFIDKVNENLIGMGFDAGIGRGVAAELKDGASVLLHFYFQEFSSDRIIGRYTFAL